MDTNYPGVVLRPVRYSHPSRASRRWYVWNKNVAPDIGAIESGTGIARLVRSAKELEGFRMRAKAVADACTKAGGEGMAVDKLVAIIEGRV